MAIHNFVDTITASISLRVSQNFTLERYNAFSSETSQIVTYSLATPTLETNSSSVLSSDESQLYVGLSSTPANNTIVVSLISLNASQPSSLNFMSNYFSSNDNLAYPTTYSFENPQYFNSEASNAYHDQQYLYIPDGADTLDLDWNSDTNYVTDQTFNFSSPPVDSGDQGGNNQGSIKEFWA